MTRVLIAFDKFKDAVTARQAGEAAAGALGAIHPDWEIDLCPLTDGGEGFCETLTKSVGGDVETVRCTGPRGDAVQAPIGYVQAAQIPSAAFNALQLKPGARLAVIEMSTASGLALLPFAARDPWRTGTTGTGEQIRAAANRGVDAILVGIGGSATNDLGFGALAALGLNFLDKNGARISNPVPATWEKIHRIDGRVSLPPLFIACDVTNPLLGPSGAAATFGPQKGLSADDLPRLEHQAGRLARLLCETHGQSASLCEIPGTGAAGGFAFGLMAAVDAQILAGSSLVANWLNLARRIEAADIVITGEGRFDHTSLAGKGPGAIVIAALQQRKSVYVFAGGVDPAVVPGSVHACAISPPSLSLPEALSRTEAFLKTAVEVTFR